MEIATKGQECVICGKFATKILEDYYEESVPFCDDCLVESYKCSYCKEENKMREGEFTYISGELYCNECSPDIELCDGCNSAINTGAEDYAENENGIFCEDCTSQ